MIIKKIAPIMVVFAISGFILFKGNASSQDEYSIELQIAPMSAQIHLDDKLVEPGTYKINKDVKVKGEKDGFSNFEQQINISDLNKDSSQYIGIALEPDKDSTKNWYAEHLDDQQKSSEISSRSSDERGDKVASKYSFLDQLPTGGQGFEIAYGKTLKTNTEKYPDSLAIYITGANIEGRLAGLKSLYTDLGVGPETIEIIFDGSYSNPFPVELPENE